MTEKEKTKLQEAFVKLESLRSQMLIQGKQLTEVLSVQMLEQIIEEQEIHENTHYSTAAVG